MYANDAFFCLTLFSCAGVFVGSRFAAAFFCCCACFFPFIVLLLPCFSPAVPAWWMPTIPWRPAPVRVRSAPSANPAATTHRCRLPLLRRMWAERRLPKRPVVRRRLVRCAARPGAKGWMNCWPAPPTLHRYPAKVHPLPLPPLLLLPCRSGLLRAPDPLGAAATPNHARRARLLPARALAPAAKTMKKTTLTSTSPWPPLGRNRPRSARRPRWQAPCPRRRGGRWLRAAGAAGAAGGGGGGGGGAGAGDRAAGVPTRMKRKRRQRRNPRRPRWQSTMTCLPTRALPPVRTPRLLLRLLLRLWRRRLHLGRPCSHGKTCWNVPAPRPLPGARGGGETRPSISTHLARTPGMACA